MEPHLYHVNLTWTHHRKGLMYSPEVKAAAPDLDYLEVATPPEFPGGVEGVWSPEHLFTAAVNSCFMTTFLAIAEFSKLSFEEFTCNASGKLEKADGKLLMSEVTIQPVVTITDESQCDRTVRVLEKAEKACLITNSIASKVIMKPLVQVGTAEKGV